MSNIYFNINHFKRNKLDHILLIIFKCIFTYKGNYEFRKSEEKFNLFTKGPLHTFSNNRNKPDLCLESPLKSKNSTNSFWIQPLNILFEFPKPEDGNSVPQSGKINAIQFLLLATGVGASATSSDHPPVRSTLPPHPAFPSNHWIVILFLLLIIFPTIPFSIFFFFNVQSYKLC